MASRGQGFSSLGAFGIAGVIQQPPAVDIDGGDLVRMVRAERGHEPVVEKDGIRATVRLVGIYTFAASVNEKNDVCRARHADPDPSPMVFMDRPSLIELRPETIEPPPGCE